MALSNGQSFNGTPLIYLSPRGKDSEGEELAQPYFEISRVNAETKKIEKTGETCTKVDGDLLFIDLRERMIRGQPLDEVVIYIGDKTNKETYHLSLSYRMFSRGLFNTLLSLTDVTKISLSYYRNKRGFESFYVTQNGEKVGWKFNLDDLPEVTDLLDAKGKKIKTDFSLVDDFFKSNLRDWATGLGILKKSKTQDGAADTAPAETAKMPKSTPTKEAAPTEKKIDDEDVPF